MNKNYPLMDEIVRVIEAEPEKWDQGYWVKYKGDFAEVASGETLEPCQTALCFAGWTAILRDWRPIYDRAWISKVRHVVTDEERHVEGIATELLGLTVSERDLLFKGDNDLDRIKQIIHDWKVDDGIVKPTCDECGQELPQPVDAA